jgi:phosphate transport system substrate-binding protein
MMRTLVIGVIAAGLMAGTSCKKNDGGDKSGSDVRLSSGGSTFVGPMMRKWKSVYNKETGVEIDYAEKGSGNGIQQMTARTYDFGCTDAPMNPDQLKAAQEKGGDVVHIPLVLGAVVPIYNLGPGKDVQLTFDSEVLAGIYLGTITSWRDDKIKKLNKGVDLPKADIVVVRRAEPSGTNFIWTDFLAKTSAAWRKKYPKNGDHGNIKIDWPAGFLGKSGNAGVATEVQKTTGAIGYVELIYALEKNITFGKVKNQDGKAVLASMEAVTAAAAGALQDEVPEDLTFNLTNKPGKDTYPICGAVWAVLYQDQTKNDNGKETVKYLRWATHEGQKQCEPLHYAPLPEGIVKLVGKKLDTVKTK